jgi:hypothetical protein
MLHKLFFIALTLHLAVLASSGQRCESPKYPVTGTLSRSVFANFAFPAFPIFGVNRRLKSVRLRLGVFPPTPNKDCFISAEGLGAYLQSVTYADVTNDGKKEAIVTLGNIWDYSGEWRGVYIFQMGGSKPQTILWSFGTGDRRFGGYKSVHSKGGDLVVELYGHDSRPNNTGHELDASCGCFTRQKYRWNGKRFLRVGRSVILEVPDND